MSQFAEETESVPGPGEVSESSATPPSEIPGYDLAGEIGHGGMGVVYRARDLTMNREVAVKILLDRYGPESTTADRFLAEAQITGQLQHPGIPAVYQVGRLPDDRRPFLAMKLIRGGTLDSLLKLGLPLNVPAVFESIAQAVGYAHAHGVIHRDLKPANIMVGAFGEVQVMDWGLAKVVSARPSAEDASELHDPDATLARTAIQDPRDSDGSFTVAGSVLGTPAFMAPEQAAGEIAKVDRRSDVFGLGAILCALLTGQPPFTGKDVDSIRLAAVRGRTEDAFARLDSCGAEPDVVDLCKRCLSFEPDDRPTNASSVAADIASLRAAADERAKQAELARARAEVQAEEQRKRRRVVLIAAGTVTAALLLGIAGTTLGLTQARTSLAETSAVLNFVEKKIFAAARPEGLEGGLGVDVTMRKAIESALPSVSEDFRDQPLTEARLRHCLGVSFFTLGEAERGRQMFQRALEIRRAKLGPNDSGTLESVLCLTWCYDALDRATEALVIKQEALGRCMAQLGKDDPLTLEFMSNVAASYLRLERNAEALAANNEVFTLRKAKFGPDSRGTLTDMNNLALSYARVGRLSEAITLAEEVLRRAKTSLGPDDATTITGMMNLADLCGGTVDRKAQALALDREALELCRAKYGPDNPSTLKIMHNLAEVYSSLGRCGEALPLHLESFERFRAKLGPDDRSTLVCMNGLATCYGNLGQSEKSLELNEEALRRCKAKLGADATETLNGMNNLAQEYRSRQKFAEALEFDREAFTRYKARFGPDNVLTLTSMSNLAIDNENLENHEVALALYRDVAQRCKATLGPDRPETLNNLCLAARCLIALKRDSEASSIADEVLRLSAGKTLDPSLFNAVIDLRLRRFQKAKDSAGCREIASTWEKRGGLDGISLYNAACFRAVTASVLGNSPEAVVEADQAMGWLKRAVAAGFNNRDQIAKDADLAALHSRADFRDLLESLSPQVKIVPKIEAK